MNAFIRKWWPVAVAVVFLGTPVALAQVGRGVGVGGRFGVPDPLRVDTIRNRTNTTLVLQDVNGNPQLTLNRLTPDAAFPANWSVTATTFRGQNNADATFGQQGTSKMLIRFPTGDGAGGNADRLEISKDGLTEANATPLTSTGDTLIDTPTGQQVRIRNNGSDILQVQSGGVLTASGKTLFVQGATTLGSGGTQFAGIISTTSAQAQGSIAANTCVDSANVTFTGATAGAACYTSPGSTGYGTAIIASCYLSASNVAKIHYCNVGTVANTPTANTYTLWSIN